MSIASMIKKTDWIGDKEARRSVYMLISDCGIEFSTSNKFHHKLIIKNKQLNLISFQMHWNEDNRINMEATIQSYRILNLTQSEYWAVSNLTYVVHIDHFAMINNQIVISTWWSWFSTLLFAARATFFLLYLWKYRAWCTVPNYSYSVSALFSSLQWSWTMVG